MAKHLWVFLLALALGVVFTPSLSAVECTADLANYNGYVVQHVQILTPIQFFSASTSGFDQLKVRLPIREKQPFSLHDLSIGQELIKEYVKDMGTDVSEKFKFVIVIGRPADCDDSARTLSVVYRVFTNIYRTHLQYTFEERITEVERPSTTGGEGGTEGRFMVRPLAGYDRTRRGYGGLDLSSTVPFAGLQSLELHSSFSSDSVIADGAVARDWRPRRAALDYAQLNVDFHYLDEPAGAAKLKEGKLALQFFATTMPMAKGEILLRYGFAMEGGHQQAATTVSQSTGFNVNSGYGAFKFYVGTTGRAGKNAFTVSYGAQAGSTFKGDSIDFVKHVADLGYTVRFLQVPKDDKIVAPSGKAHKPWDLEFHLSGGVIQNFGAIPAAERFFGGNQPQPFIDNGSWAIPGGASIRSIPQNRLGGLSTPGILGGTRFYSGNFTLAKVLWGRPLVPKELAEDPQFVPVLNGAIETAKGTLADYYQINDPVAKAAYATATLELDVISNTGNAVTAQLNEIPGALATIPAIRSSANNIRSGLRAISRIVNSIKNGDKTQFIALIDRKLPLLETEIENLVKPMTDSGQSQIAAEITNLNNQLDVSRNTIKNILATVNSTAARDRANRDFSAAQKVLNAFLYELNIYSIAPVGVFDVARVWPTGIGTRYAAGGGVRLSLVNMNLTLAYAANPTRNRGEGRGALFIKLDVEDLFR